LRQHVAGRRGRLGQIGGGSKWFDVNRAINYSAWAEVLSFRDDGGAAAWVGEAARAYAPEAGLPQAGLVRVQTLQAGVLQVIVE
jgi:hypothetical protein